MLCTKYMKRSWHYQPVHNCFTMFFVVKVCRKIKKKNNNKPQLIKSLPSGQAEILLFKIKQTNLINLSLFFLNSEELACDSIELAQ